MLDKRHSNDRWDHACTCPVITWKHKFRLPGAGKFLRMISLSSVPGLTIDYPFHQIPLFTSTHKQARWAALPSEVLTSGKYSWSRRSWFLLSSSRRPPRPDYGPPSFSVCLQMSLVVYNTHSIDSTFPHPSYSTCCGLFEEGNKGVQPLLLFISIVGHLSRRPSSAPPAVRQLRLCVFTTQAGSCQFWGIFLSTGWCHPFQRLASMILVALKCLKFKAELMNIVSFTEYFYNELETCQKLRMKRGKGCFTWTNSGLTDIHDTYDQNRQLLQHKTPSLSNKWVKYRNGAQLMVQENWKEEDPVDSVKMSFTGFPEETNPGIQVQGAVPRKVRR